MHSKVQAQYSAWLPVNWTFFPHCLLCHLLLFSHSVVTKSLWPHGWQHARLPCPSPSPRVCSNSCSLGQWCHPTISSSVVPLSSCLQSFPATGSFRMSWLFPSRGQSIGTSTSASVPMNIQDWIPLGLTDLISLQSKGLPRIFSNTTAQKHQFFSVTVQLSHPYMTPGKNMALAIWTIPLEAVLSNSMDGFLVCLFSGFDLQEQLTLLKNPFFLFFMSL